MKVRQFWCVASVAAMALMAAQAGAARTSHASSFCSPGDVRTVSKTVPAATSKKAWDAAVDAAVAKDDYGYAELFYEGKLVNLHGGARVRVLDIHFTYIVIR